MQPHMNDQLNHLYHGYLFLAKKWNDSLFNTHVIKVYKVYKACFCPYGTIR